MQSVKTAKNKFIIEFNKKLTVKHQLTIRDGEEIKDQKVFEKASCYLNFHADSLEFQFQTNNHRWSSFEIVNKKVVYEYTDSQHKRFARVLYVVNDESAVESNFTIFDIRATFKDVVLNLFSPLKKQFKLKISYKLDLGSYETVLLVAVPIVDQKDWYPRVSGTDVYRADILGGAEMMNLFKNDFKLVNESTDEEKFLRSLLLDYVNASTIKRFKDFDTLNMLQNMLIIEDLRNQKEMEDFSVTRQTVLHYDSFPIYVRNIIDNHLRNVMCFRKMRAMLESTFVISITKKMSYDAMEFDHIYLTDMEDYQNYSEDLYEIMDKRVVGKILYIFDNLVLFQRKRKQTAVLENHRLYHVEFVPNRMSTRVAHRAVEDAAKNHLASYLRNFTGVKPHSDKKDTVSFKWMNKTIGQNREQEMAVRNIFNRSSFPSPYIVFGPPGTGKSSTIIEAIAQIVKLRPKTHILVTAKSNASCDDIGNRLLKYVSCNKVLRIYSPAFDKKPDKIDKAMQAISNFRNRHYCECKMRSCPEIEPIDDPSYEEFYTARVIITTLVSCGRIISAGIKSNHFDYIFVDEAASESEPYTLIPISGLGATADDITAQIVLSGDHMQLGSIVRDRFCRKMGMEKSMMERIMETIPQYQKSPKYNQKFVTQLVNNYRSHPAILQFSNENFYGNKLIPKCRRDVANFACGWDLLLRNKDFPLMFHTTRTNSKEVGLSLMNEGEINIVNGYIMALVMLGINGQKVEQSDIGIITPYRAQRERLHEQFKSSYPKIEIGTVDAFQGREKRIIILSTVRSRTKHVGFLRNEKRLNVSLTRAQSLLIIVGNSATLQKCLIWNKFIAYCHNNQAIVGDSLSLNEDALNDENYDGDDVKPAEIEDEYDN